MAISDINPVQYATQLADNFTAPAQNRLSARLQNAKAQRDALSQLQTALQTFKTALSGMSSKATAVTRTSTFNREGIATATASAKAAAGNYSLFVEKVATNSQVAFNNLYGTSPSSGQFQVNLAGGKSFQVDLSRADANGDGSVSPDELARAINSNPQNTSLVTAMLVSANGKTQLVLSSAQTGADQQISVNTAGLTDPALASALSAPTVLSAADDAVVWLGGQTSGIRMQQGSNTFTGITGVSLTVSQAMKAGDAPLTLSVANDNAGTAKNVQTVVDAFNTLRTTLDKMLSPGKPADKIAAGALSGDSAVQGLRDKLATLMRTAFNGQSLISLGISSDRTGQLSVDSTRLQKALAKDPSVLDATLFGPNGKSGLLQALTSTTDSWVNFTNGNIKKRQDNLALSQKSLDSEQIRIATQHDQAYARYLAQFSKLQAMQSQMSKTMDMLTNL